MKITHREPIAFNVACINSKSFFKNAGFLKIGFFENWLFWKFGLFGNWIFLEIQTSKSRFIFCCSARLFFKSRIVTD